MVTQITWKATITSTCPLPGWAPEIADASTGTGSLRVILLVPSATTSGEEVTEACNLETYTSTSIHLRADLKMFPLVTFTYTSVNDLVRTV